jgi:hypothetical protein
LLSSKKIFVFILLTLPVIFLSCGDREPEIDPAVQYNSPDFVLTQAKNAVSENVKTAFKGTFDEDTVLEVSAGEEIVNDINWGIKFYLLKIDGKKLKVDTETELLEGSFTDCLFRKIKFPGYNYELLYYNSQGFFLGSGGGEVFSYIIDFNKEETYTAHLFTNTDGSVSLFLSDNIDETEIKNFFLSNFKKDYPALQIVSEDVDLEL